VSVYAQEYGHFFNSNNGDRTYNADSLETWMKPFFESGVFANCLQVTAQSTPSMSLDVAAGYAYLDGKTAYWPVTNAVTLANASGVYNRIDTVVLRRDDTNRRISIEVVTGTASASPQPTAPTRNGDIFELVLAQIYVGVGVTEITQANITDKRPDTDVCGYVMCTIETPDFSELYAQFEEQAAEAIESGTDDFMTWYDHMKDQLDEDAAGHLQLEIDAITDEIGDTVLPTTAQTLTGGIAENNQAISAQSQLDAKIKSDIGIVEDTNTATHTIASGQYVIWKGELYKAKTAIPSGTTLSTSNLDAVSNGIANELNANIIPAPSVVSLTDTNGCAFSAQFISGIGFFIYMALPKIPTAVSTSNGEYYDGSWKSFSVEKFRMCGSTCIIKMTVSQNPSQSGTYGLRGILNITY